MDYDLLIEKLKDKKQCESLLTDVLEDQSMLAVLLDVIEKEKSSVKFTCSKIIRLASETNPGLVYPYFDKVVGMMRSDISFIKWDGIATLSNLAKVDRNLLFDKIFDEYFDLIQDPQMITAATVVGNAWKIVSAKPDREAEITNRLLSVPENVYYNRGEPSPECNNILCGHVIDCIEIYYQVSNQKSAILAYLDKQRCNTRNSTARKAEILLKKTES